MENYKSVSKTSNSIKEIAADFKRHLNVSDYEAFSLALKVEQLKLFKQAHVISSDDNYPSALEKIAIMMDDK